MMTSASTPMAPSAATCVAKCRNAIGFGRSKLSAPPLPLINVVQRLVLVEPWAWLDVRKLKSPGLIDLLGEGREQKTDPAGLGPPLAGRPLFSRCDELLEFTRSRLRVEVIARDLVDHPEIFRRDVERERLIAVDT